MVPFHLPHSTDLFSVLMKEVSTLETRRSFCLIAAKRIFLRQKHTTKVMSRQQCCCLEGKRWFLILLIDRCQSPQVQPWVLLNLKYRRFQDPLLRWVYGAWGTIVQLFDGRCCSYHIWTFFVLYNRITRRKALDCHHDCSWIFCIFLITTKCSFLLVFYILIVNSFICLTWLCLSNPDRLLQINQQFPL